MEGCSRENEVPHEDSIEQMLNCLGGSTQKRFVSSENHFIFKNWTSFKEGVVGNSKENLIAKRNPESS